MRTKEQLIPMPLLRFIALFVICSSGLIASCGGSSSTNPASTVVLQVVPGPWTGTYNLNNSSDIPVTGTVSSGGFGYFADKQGNVFMIQFVPQQSPFTSTIIGIAPAGQVFSDGNHIDTFLVNGNYTSTTTETNMTASLTGIDTGNYTQYAGFATTGFNGNFTMTSFVTDTGTPSVASLTGQWDGYYTGKSSTSVAITINADATISGNDGYGCSISGSIVQQDPGSNVFFVNYIASGSSCPGVMNGLAFESTKDVSGAFGNATGLYLYMGVFSPNVAYSVELKMQ
ncbi:MAG: hypothetical protein ACRETA_07835 [Gammaproteobacteria bacterium]